MAINVESNKSETSKGENIALILLILILFISFGLYFFLSFIYLPDKKEEANLLSGKVANLTVLISEGNKDDPLSAQNKINDFKVISDNSLKVSNFFESFEAWAHPEIVYSNLKFDSLLRKVSISGKTKNNNNLMQQISIWNSDETIESYDLSNIVIAINGETSFNINLVIKESVFR